MATGVSQLPDDVATVLRNATATACQKLRMDSKGVWADALLPLAHAEWKRLRPVATRGTLRCQASDLLQFITPPTATRTNSHRPLDPCAIAAVAALATVSRVCALVQVRSYSQNIASASLRTQLHATCCVCACVHVSFLHMQSS